MTRLIHYTKRKVKYSIKGFLSKTADLVKFIEKNLNVKLHFLCSDSANIPECKVLEKVDQYILRPPSYAYKTKWEVNYRYHT